MTAVTDTMPGPARGVTLLRANGEIKGTLNTKRPCSLRAGAGG